MADVASADGEGREGGGAEAVVDNNDQDHQEKQQLREDLVASAVAFLTNPKVVSAEDEKKRNFLRGKGLTEEEIQEAEKRAADSNSNTGSGLVQQQQPLSTPPTSPPRRPWEGANTATSGVPLAIENKSTRSSVSFTPYRFTQLAALLGAAVGLAYYYRDSFPWSTKPKKEEKKTIDGEAAISSPSLLSTSTSTGTVPLNSPAVTANSNSLQMPAESATTSIHALESQVTSLTTAVEKLQHSLHEVSSSLREKEKLYNLNNTDNDTTTMTTTAGVVKSGIGGDEQSDRLHASLDLVQELRELKEMFARGAQHDGRASQDRYNNNTTSNSNSNYDELVGSSFNAHSPTETQEFSSRTVTTVTTNNLSSTNEDKMKKKQQQQQQQQQQQFAFHTTTNNNNDPETSGIGLSPGFSELASPPQLFNETSISSTSRSFMMDHDNNNITPTNTDSVMSSVKALSSRPNFDSNNSNNSNNNVSKNSPKINDDYQKFLKTVDQPQRMSSKGKEPMYDDHLTINNNNVNTNSTNNDFNGDNKNNDSNGAQHKSDSAKALKDPPHPQSYLEVMQALQEGRAIPGIKHIDDSPPNPKQPFPETNANMPVKPWSRSNSNGNNDGTFMKSSFESRSSTGKNGFDNDRIPSWMSSK